MRSPYFISKILSDYGYEVTVTTSAGATETEINETLSVGLEYAKMESEIINEKTVNTLNWMFDNNTYTNKHGATVKDLVTRIWKDGVTVIEDRSLEEPVIEENYLGEIQTITVPNKRIFDEQIPIATKFLSVYCQDTASYLFNSCIRENGKINKSEVSRYMRLLSLIKADDRGVLAKEIATVINDIYNYVDRFNDPDYKITNEMHEAMIDGFSVKYLSELKLKLRTDKMISKYREEISGLVSVLTKKSHSNKNVVLSFRMLPTPDNDYMRTRREYDDTINKIFGISDGLLPEDVKRSIRERHLSAS
jgi:hypothetical protein